MAVRRVLRPDAGEWVLRWHECGWAPSGQPTTVGSTDDGREVIRVVLEPIISGYSDATCLGHPSLPEWSEHPPGAVPRQRRQP